MATLLTLFGALFAAIGTIMLIVMGNSAGFSAWTCAAVFFVGGALVQELRDRLPHAIAPRGPGDAPGAPLSIRSRLFG